MKKLPDYSLYFVSAEIESLGRSHLDTMLAAAEGGASVIQLRDKNASTAEICSMALKVRDELRKKGIPLIINDRVEVAREVGADGLHIGQSDAAIRKARKAVGENVLIGVSVSTIEEAKSAEAEGADYLGVGPIFATTSKPDALPPIGLEGLEKIRRATSLPIVAIGGIGMDRVTDVVKAGADGIAVIAAIAEAPDMISAAQNLKNTIFKALGEGHGHDNSIA